MQSTTSANWLSKGKIIWAARF